MAHITITGNLGKTPELKHSSSGKAWATFSLAWSERIRDAQGNWDQGPTVWVQVAVFGKLAEAACANLSKGMQVQVTGRIQPESWSSNQGEETVLKLSADNVSPTLFFQDVQVTKRESSGGGMPRQQAQNDPWQSAPVQSQGGFSATQDEDPPF